MADALELETRRRIFQQVTHAPGVHFRELQRALGLQPGSLEYHIAQLERAGLLTAQEEGGRKRFFVVAQVSHPDKAVLGLLRQATPRHLLLLLLERPGRSFQELHREVGGAKSTLPFHMRKLTDSGLVAVEQEDREHLYRVVEAVRVATLLVTYRESFLDAAVDRFAEVWLDLNRR